MFRGQLKERDGDLEGAAADYRRTLERDPNRLSAHYRLAAIEGRLGRRDRAAHHRKRWEELRDAQVQLSRADADYRAALDAAATESNPTALADLRAATRRLGLVCETLGWSRAAEACRQIIATL
jgi:tetratricopeptide (TPR) repeat protein